MAINQSVGRTDVEEPKTKSKQQKRPGNLRKFNKIQTMGCWLWHYFKRAGLDAVDVLCFVPGTIPFDNSSKQLNAI